MRLFLLLKGIFMKRKEIKNLTLSSMFLALAMLMPFLTGQIQQIGTMLCPMHIPVLLCGFFCGGPWGLLVGAVAPVLRSAIFGMPPMFPTAVCMVAELGTYGLVAGMLHNRLPKVKWNVYVSLIIAMIVGRAVWGLAMFSAMGLDTNKFGFSAFMTGAFVNAIPGIILQLILIPIIVLTLEKHVKNM